MKDDCPTASTPGEAQVFVAPGGPAPYVERRSSARRASRGDKHRLSPSVVVSLVQAWDVLLLLLSGLVATVFFSPAKPREGSYFLATLAGTTIALWFLVRGGAYSLPALSSFGKQLKNLTLSLLGGVGCMIITLFLMRVDGRLWPLVWLSTSLVLALTARAVLSPVLGRWSHSGRLARRVAIVGTGDFSRVFIERLRSEPDFYTVVGLYDDRLSRAPAEQDGIKVRGTVHDLLERSRQEQIDLIVIALPLHAIARISAILEQIGSAVADICLTTDFVGFQYRSSQISSVGTNPVVLMGEQPLKDWRAARKRAFDLAAGSLMLVALSPFLALIALAIRLDSEGPIFFRQPRMGFNNRTFICYKFRSMRHALADLSGGVQATRGDARITRLGKWLRPL